jgi:hypothetical protein
MQIMVLPCKCPYILDQQYVRNAKSTCSLASMREARGDVIFDLQVVPVGFRM